MEASAAPNVKERTDNPGLKRDEKNGLQYGVYVICEYPSTKLILGSPEFLVKVLGFFSATRTVDNMWQAT